MYYKNKKINTRADLTNKCAVLADKCVKGMYFLQKKRPIGYRYPQARRITTSHFSIIEL